MNKFRTELWRIVKFLLITISTTLLFAAMYLSFNDAALQPESRCYELLDGTLYVLAGLCVLTQTLLHRWLVFRTNGPWWTVVIMVLLALFLTYVPFSNDSTDPDCARVYTPAYLSELAFWMVTFWLPVSYLLQRCVIYCHTTDTNSWYRRFHPDTNEKGE